MMGGGNQDSGKEYSSWNVESIVVAMNVRLDGCIVPSSVSATVPARVSYSHVVVLDNFLDDNVRLPLLECLSEIHVDKDVETFRLREEIWDRKTSDRAGSRPTWGITDDCLDALRSHPSLIEIMSRLSRLYPEYDIAFLPSDDIQDETQASNCSNILVNAAVEGDQYEYHVDADPTSFPSSSSWVQKYGDYFNGEPGKPLLVSLVAYLNSSWGVNDGADTLVLDLDSDTGVFIRPKAGRVILMHQDVLHRLSSPTTWACGRPRFSIVLKLMFIPKDDLTACSISRKEFGRVVSFGSASKIDNVLRNIKNSV
jgi:hypothetical protein